jgi:transcriptional regulator with XRE-family HTH domain
VQTIGERLQLLRAERGYTLTHAAERAGLTRKTLSEIERGIRHPYLPTLNKLANAYDLSPTGLLHGTDALGGLGPEDEPRATGRPRTTRLLDDPEIERVLVIEGKHRTHDDYEDHLRYLIDDDDPARVRQNLIDALDELYETEERLVDWLRYSYAFQRWLPADTQPKEGETESGTAARVAMQRDRLGRKLSHEIRSEYVYRACVLINTSKDLERAGQITRAIDEDTRADVRLKHLKESAQRVRPYPSDETERFSAALEAEIGAGV